MLAIGPYLLPMPAGPDEPAESFTRPGGRFITAAGTRTWIQEAGPADGPAVVLIHGFGGSTFSWRSTMPALADAGYRAIALDLRGFGLSDKRFDADYRPAAQAAFVAAVMDELGVERAAVVGHSMGGDVAAHLAVARPELVSGLVLVDAATGPDARGGPGGPLAGFLLALPPMQRLGQVVLRNVATPARVADLLRSAYLDPATVTPDVEAGYLVPQRLPDWDLALLGIVRDTGKDPLGDRFETIAAPTLVIWGERDPWVPLAVGEAIREALPASGWSVIPNSGHLPFEEQPEAFMSALLPFLETTT